LKPSSSGLGLKSRRKFIASDGTASTRVKSSKRTITKVLPLCVKIGVTRIADITFMDRLRVPNYSAVLPGTEDNIWVYSGKGTTKSHAKASALMEAIERYCSLSNTYHRSFIQGSYYQLSKSYHKVLHPAEVVEPVNHDYHDKDTIMDFLLGFDLLANEKVLVPAEIALYGYSPKYPALHAFSHFHTNGLASGNVLEEAISHALCEVIERDAVSIADLSASSIPYNILEKIVHSLKKQYKYGDLAIRIPLEDKFVDDSSIFPDVDISEIAKDFDPVKRLVKGFVDADISLLIKDVTQKDIGIPTFVASSVEWMTRDYGYFAKGSGTHPDSRIALIRAITEVSQTRATNIQGARDDLKKIEYKENNEIHKRKWQFMDSSSLTKQNNHNNNTIIKFQDIQTHMNKDILDDINLILNSLKKSGLKRAIIVDLTNPSIGIPVVRAIVPGLETFAVTQSIMGRRAKEYFRRLYYF
jgi:ribosomal protein S12 methylthiotransferase accessory factor YcaO